jgi:DNA ligase 1
LGIGETLLMKAIANATGRPMSAIKSDFEEHGDLGLVAQASRSNQSTMFKPKRLTCTAVFKGLKDVAMASGQSAVNKKMEKIRSLLVACEGSESKFIFRY